MSLTVTNVDLSVITTILYNRPMIFIMVVITFLYKFCNPFLKNITESMIVSTYKIHVCNQFHISIDNVEVNNALLICLVIIPPHIYLQTCIMLYWSITCTLLRLVCLVHASFVSKMVQLCYILRMGYVNFTIGHLTS